jgi:small subunit ribosomal protein S20
MDDGPRLAATYPGHRPCQTEIWINLCLHTGRFFPKQDCVSITKERQSVKAPTLVMVTGYGPAGTFSVSVHEHLWRLTFVCGSAIMSHEWQDNQGGMRILANTKSAIKRIRSAERRRKINQIHRSRARTFVKRTRRLVEGGQIEEAEAMAREAVSALDKAAAKGVIHKNNASRRKSRLLKYVNQAKQQSA